MERGFFLRLFRFARGANGYLTSSKPLATRVSARVHCVPGEGWSPAEPEHWGEAPRRCRSHLRCVVRRASPAVAQQCGPSVAACGRGAGRARRARERGAPVVASRHGEPAVASRRVPRAGVDDDHDGTADHDDAAAADDHDIAADHDHASAGYCASPTLSFGTVLTIVNNASGASTTCTVDDREAAGYPRVVDLSPEGFDRIADTSQGVVQVTISW